jgi:hypothetical protein
VLRHDFSVCIFLIFQIDSVSVTDQRLLEHFCKTATLDPPKLGFEKWLKNDFFAHFRLDIANRLRVKFPENIGGRGAVAEQFCRLQLFMKVRYQQDESHQRYTIWSVWAKSIKAAHYPYTCSRRVAEWSKAPTGIRSARERWGFGFNKVDNFFLLKCTLCQ